MKLIYKYIFIISVVFSTNLISENTSKNICKGIMTLSPRIDIAYCNHISEIINKYSNEFKIDWRIPVAIFKKESNFDYTAVNYKSHDYGIGQINSYNMRAYKLNLGKQLTDAEYSIRSTFLILNSLKRYKTGSKGHLQWFTRYHSFTEQFRYIYFHEPISQRGLKKYLDMLYYNVQGR